jgi:hypothetical protein
MPVPKAELPVVLVRLQGSFVSPAFALGHRNPRVGALKSRPKGEGCRNHKDSNARMLGNPLELLVLNFGGRRVQKSALVCCLVSINVPSGSPKDGLIALE